MADLDLLERLLLGGLLIVAALHLPLVFRINVGWDELRFLSDVYTFRNGELASNFQNLHVHLFQWLVSVGGTEVDQVVVGRLVYYLLLLGSAGFLYLIARRFLDRPPALFAPLLWLTYAEVLGYGTTFRYDGLATFLLLAATALAARVPGSGTAVAGAAALTATAHMVTIKSVFYLPTILLLLAAGRVGWSWRGALVRPAVFVAASTLFFSALYLLHQNVVGADGVASAAFVQRSVATGIAPWGLFPQPGYMARSILGNLWTWTFLVSGLVLLVLRARAPAARLHPLLCVLAIPLLALPLYRNTFPYFYVLMMPLPLILAAVPFQEASRRLKAGPPGTALAMLGIVMLGFAAHLSFHWTDETRAQRQLLEVVHRVFPQPTPYIDSNSTVASFRKVGFFMSDWGFTHYHAGGRPIFRDILTRESPPFMLVLHPALLPDLPPDYDSHRLFPEDEQILRDNFVPHWRNLFVAGKQAHISAGAPTNLEILIPGEYTVEGEVAVRIDGAVRHPGDVVVLGQGPVRVEGLAGPSVVTLRWGQHLKRPTEAPIADPIFRGFYPCRSPFGTC